MGFSMSGNFEKKMLKTAKRELLYLYKCGVSAVLPRTLIKEKVKILSNSMIIGEKQFLLTRDVYIVGFGKAVAGMATELEKYLGPKLKKGIISIPKYSFKQSLKKACINQNIKSETLVESAGVECLPNKFKSVIEYFEGGENNLPDNNSLLATKEIIKLVQSLSKNATLIVLISGGGSALLTQPKQGISIDSKLDLCKKLQNAGADIIELNQVRKQLSSVKGGGLASAAYPCSVITLILSDIIGNPISLIASGPTCPKNKNSSEQVIQILKKYSLYDSLSNDVKKIIKSTEDERLENSLIEDGKFKHVENILIGSNLTALEAIGKAAKRFSLQAIILSDSVDGNVCNVSLFYAKITKLVCLLLEGSLTKETFIKEMKISENFKISESKIIEMFETITVFEKNQGIILIMGGEPTVVVTGKGKGGRNQELALSYSLDWLAQTSKNPELLKYFAVMLSIGSDGQDGPTDAAGAFGSAYFEPKIHKMYNKLYSKLLYEQEHKIIDKGNELEILHSKLLQLQEMFPESVLNRNDSYNFFSRFEYGSNIVKTGLTGTNVMDFHFIYIKRKEWNCAMQDSKNYDFVKKGEDIDFLFLDEHKTYKSKL